MLITPVLLGKYLESAVSLAWILTETCMFVSIYFPGPAWQVPGVGGESLLLLLCTQQRMHPAQRMGRMA
jgi:hypothetical protein